MNEDLIKEAYKERFTLEVEPSSWVLPNRGMFPSWVDVTFKFMGKRNKKPTTAMIKQACDCEEKEDATCPPKVTLFPHQQFVADLLQYASPYRGVLLYFGLGSGKTLSAIAAAEILSNNMKVIVMTPASLRGNFIEEIKKYGKSFYSLNQKWIFIPMKETSGELLSLAGVPGTIVKQNQGMWIPTSKGTQFAELPEESKSQIQIQVEAVITNKFRFINYNGLRKDNINKLTENNVNPFDNSCVIIDEIHNLISRVVNKRTIGRAIYRLLMTAENAKLILLSGTPVINYPHEIAYIINLLTGPKKQYELKFAKDNDVPAKVLKTLFEQNKYIDKFNIEANLKKVTFELLPVGFQFKIRPYVVRSDEDAIKTDDEVIDTFLNSLTTAGVKFIKKVNWKNGLTIPDDEDEFNKYFVDMEQGKFINKEIFSKRILGTVAYYNTFSPELFPEVTTKEVLLPLTDYQFSIYEKSRGEERRKEMRSKGKGAGEAGSLFKDGSQVYRFFSRANCNFVFPESIKRPFPSNFGSMKNELDMVDDGKDLVTEQDTELKSKKEMQAEYEQKLNAALIELDNNKETHLALHNLKKLFSPKIADIVKKLLAAEGSTMVYSQFRTVEGLGILGMALRAQGWQEFKLKKVDGDWVPDVDNKAETGKYFVMFTGNNEQSKLLLKVFNGDLETVPEKIKTFCKDVLVKTIMITQSGAEGISLKNVREVHVMEPYWNNIRIDQVIGRAVRTCSHIGLPRNERNVTVYLYRMTFTKKQLENSFTLRTQDKGMTSDEYIYNVAQRKAKIINELQEVVQKASVDCGLRASPSNKVTCFSYPINIPYDAVVTEFDIARDQTWLTGVDKNEWVGQVLITKKGQFLIRPETNEVYDYDIYMDAGKLVKLGTITEDKKRIEISLK